MVYEPSTCEFAHRMCSFGRIMRKVPDVKTVEAIEKDLDRSTAQNIEYLISANNTFASFAFVSPNG